MTVDSTDSAQPLQRIGYGPPSPSSAKRPLHWPFHVFPDGFYVSAASVLPKRGTREGCRRSVIAARKHGFADIAHVFMRDHVHVLIEGERSDSDFIKWLHLWRQLSGFYWRQRTGNYLWKEGYWDYTLRTEDSVRGVASYIAWNPVRAGLVTSPAEYPWIGSERFTVEELASVAPTRPRFSDG